MIRAVLTSGYHRANGQSWIKWIKTAGGVECGMENGMMWALPYLQSKSAFGRSQ